MRSKQLPSARASWWPAFVTLASRGGSTALVIALFL